MFNKTFNFLVLCLGARFGLTLLAKNINKKYYKYICMFTLFTSLGFLRNYLFDLRKTGPEAEGIIWWNKLRPIHGILYLLFTIYAYKKENFAWIILLVDTCLGLLFWYLRYYQNMMFI